MTQEQKELLLKDLCERLPYGVKYNFDNNDGCDYTMNIISLNAIDDIFPIEQIKPYLFPLSSLTEKQRNDISKLLIDTQTKFSPFGKLNPKGYDNLFLCTVKQANVLINYCLIHHLDINGLISMGLAIDATNLNIY